MRNESHAPPPDAIPRHERRPAAGSSEKPPLLPPDSTIANVSLHNSPGLPQIGDNSLWPFAIIAAAVLFFGIAVAMFFVMRSM